MELKNILQRKDDELTGTFNSPGVRFVERGGNTITDLMKGKKEEEGCGSTDCLICWSKGWIGEEAEKMTAAKMEGTQTPYTVTKEDTKALGSCTKEGANYENDCITCRTQGKIRRYYGETSRSTYQRGKEHLKG